jgi:hypothetical protein
MKSDAGMQSYNALLCFLFGKEEPECKPQQKRGGDDDPLGCSEQCPDEELEGGLLEVLHDEDKPHHHGNDDENDLSVFRDSSQAHDITHQLMFWKISHGAAGCVNRSFIDRAPAEIKLHFTVCHFILFISEVFR